MKILIGADFVPTESNYKEFINSNLECMLGDELCNILSSVDYRIFNLELPLTDNGACILKCGPNLRAPTSTVAGYKGARIDLLTLANNHIMDYGVAGLQSTIQVLKDNGIHHVGAGMNRTKASKPFIIDGREKIAIYACTEQEFSVTDGDYPGANPYDPLESYDEVQRLSNQASYVIVLYHGGKEEYRYPSPVLQKRCKKFVDKGANLVVCQHSHCIGCREKYGEGEIIYGQGNALFDLESNEYWNSGLLVLCDSEVRTVEYIPLEKRGSGVRVAKNGASILRDFYDRSEQIARSGFIAEEYERYAQEYKRQYYKCLVGIGDWLIYRMINRLSHNKLDRVVARGCAKTRRLLNWKNMIQCEAHSELLLQAIETDIRRKKNGTNEGIDNKV